MNKTAKVLIDFLCNYAILLSESDGIRLKIPSKHTMKKRKEEKRCCLKTKNLAKGLQQSA